MSLQSERKKMLRARGLREVRLIVPDVRSKAVRRRIAKQVARLKPDSEHRALLWLETVGEFDADSVEPGAA